MAGGPVGSPGKFSHQGSLTQTHLFCQIVLVQVPSEVELVLYRDGDIEELAEGEVGLDEGQVGRGGRVHGHAGVLLPLLLFHPVSFSKV